MTSNLNTLNNNEMKFPERYRKMGERYGDGVFIIPYKALTTKKVFCMLVIASSGMGWDHVSVSIKIMDTKTGKLSEAKRCPTWEEMCEAKSFFWNEEETVMQLHPPKSQWVSTHPYCLHLWRPQFLEIPLPEQIMVGIPGTNIQ